jgi:hypothetical protein
MTAQIVMQGVKGMRSMSTIIVKTAPHQRQAKRASGPVACALFIAALAIVVTGGTLWLTSAVVHSNTQAATTIFNAE